MENRIEIEEYATQKMIHAYVSGTLTEPERISLGKEIVVKFKDNNINKVIFDLREAELGYSLIGSHLAILSLSDLGMTKDDYGAVIYSHDKEQMEHAENVAHNHNIFNVRFFQNINEGIEWLASKG